MSKILKEASSAFNELIRMHELNEELLETLTTTMLWVKDYTERYNIPIPHRNGFLSLVKRAEALIAEISSDAPPFLQHPKRTPEDATEPFSIMFISYCFAYG